MFFNCKNSAAENFDLEDVKILIDELRNNGYEA